MSHSAQQSPLMLQLRRGALLTLLLTPAALLIHGYHPFSEDGGVYTAGIEHLLNPTLFPTYTPFVTEHLRFSLFAPLVATLTRTTHLPLPAILLTLYLLSLWATLFAAWRLVALLTPADNARTSAVLLLACTLTTPIAGTSLILADPYLTARSLTTPLGLLTLAFTLQANLTPVHRRRNLLLITLTLLAAALLHPLMAAYTLAAVLLISASALPTPRQRWLAYLALTALALLLATLLQRHAPAETPAYAQVVYTRYYWFPHRWQSYEQFGLTAPLIIFAAFLRSRPQTPASATLLRATLALSTIALLVAALFARNRLATHLVARLQPLRTFQTTYLVLILILGALAGELLLRNRPLRLAAAFLPLTLLMAFVQRNLYPADLHLEFPGRAPTNPWQQAFFWARDHTPTSALFALDAHYITRTGEDAQCFRPLAERSALPDYSKDGGETSITPALTPDWLRGQHAQTNLNIETDPDRLTHLQGTGATWIILPTTSRTAFLCPYRNSSVQVCRLP